MIEPTIDVSVDDKRALWALTARHLRSAAHPAVLLVRHAIRRGARSIDVRTRGDVLVVSDDGRDLDVELAELAIVLSAPEIGVLQGLEQRRGGDLLVAVVTAAASSCTGRSGQRLTTIDGAFDSAPVDVGAARNEVRLTRPRALRERERQELRAWLPAPHARIVVDGRRLVRAVGAPPRLPESAVMPRSIVADGGRLQLGFALDETITRVTILARGTWVAQEHLRPRGLPVVAIWDDDTLPPRPGDVTAHARDVVVAAADDAMRALAARFQTVPAAQRRRLRSVLLRGERLHEAFVDVALFDDETGPFRRSLTELRAMRRVVVGARHGDVIVDDDTSAFLHRALPATIVEALPPPRRRLRLLLRRWGA